MFVGILNLFCAYTSIKYFPISYAVVMRNIAPFIAVLLSALFLSESPSLFRTFLLSATVGLGLGYIFSGKTADSEEESTLDLADLGRPELIFAWFCLIGTPFFSGMGMTLNRALRKLDERTVNTFQNFFALFIFLITAAALDQDVGFFREFGW